MASSQTKKESTWELSKENVKPVKSGRDVHCIAAVLQPSKQDMKQLTNEKQLFEEEIIAGTNEEDPLEPWDRYLKWTIQYFPSGGNDLTLLNLVRKLITKFNSEQYRNDIRYVNAWLKLAEIMKDPFETYSYMNTEGIGSECAEFYIAWAEEYEKYGDVRRAHRIYNSGDEKCAQPRDLLQQMHMEFQLRAARVMLNNGSNNDSEADNETDSRTQQRTALGNLKGKGKKQTVGVQRTGRALQSLQTPGLGFGRTTQQNMPQSGGFQIFEDDDPKCVNVMGEVGKWATAPSRDAAKENTKEAAPWRDAKMKRSHIRPQLTSSIPIPPGSNFTVYDEEQECAMPHAAHKIATNVESVLSVKKEGKNEFNEFENIFNDKPIHETNCRSAYDIEKVYTAMGEMQFEEVRAAHWRIRQRREREKERMERELKQEDLELQNLERERLMFEQKQEVEEERRKLDEERMKMMELERDRLKLERKLMENRRRRMLTKTANMADSEEDQILSREEDDITIKLNSVKQDIKKAHLAYDITPNGNLKENNIYTEQQISQIVPKKPVSSANSSLNLSKRSQPSPTINTKEAMCQLDSWFQKPLEDDNDMADSVIVPDGFNKYQNSQDSEGRQGFSFRPINNAVQPPAKPAFVSKNDTVPFVIFNEKNENAGNRTTVQPVTKRKGLSEMHIPQPLLQIGSDPQSSENFKESRSNVEDDKTGYCFDDVTVAGNQFADKAHLASTPFCSKYEKFQDMAHINHISRIQPEITLTENVANYHQSDSREVKVDTIETKAPEYSGDNVNEMLYATDVQDIPMEAKQLSPIMEASNESDKSVMGTTKSYLESDKTQLPSPNNVLAQEPLPMKSFGSEFSKTTDFGTHNNSAKKTDMFSIDDYLDYGSINCNLWDENEKRKQFTEYNSAFPHVSVVEDGVFISPAIGHQPVDEKINNICDDFNSTSIKENNTEVQKHSSLANVIMDPWDDQLLNSIMKKHEPLSENSSIMIQYMDEPLMPKIRKGVQLNLGDKNVRVGQVRGEGAYAKVFDVFATDDENWHQVVKAQLPPCPWEVYTIIQAKSRLKSKGLTDVADAIVDIDSAHFYEDGSLLLMQYLGKGTLLDLVNSNRGTRMKDVIAMWIAYQVMRVVVSLHTVGIIHGDVKPDNFMVVPFESSDLAESMSTVNGVKLVDFGRAIDMTEMPHGASFMNNCCTSAFTCIQMQNKEPWNYHTDLYGIAGTLHVVLFGSYMKVRQGKDGQWEIQNKIKRWHNQALWKDFFTTLLNFPTPTEERPITLSSSPLPRLILKMDHILKELGSRVDVITGFFNGFK